MMNKSPRRLQFPTYPGRGDSKPTPKPPCFASRLCIFPRFAILEPEGPSPDSAQLLACITTHGSVKIQTWLPAPHCLPPRVLPIGAGWLANFFFPERIVPVLSARLCRRGSTQHCVLDYPGSSIDVLTPHHNEPTDPGPISALYQVRLVHQEYHVGTTIRYVLCTWVA